MKTVSNDTWLGRISGCTKAEGGNCSQKKNLNTKMGDALDELKAGVRRNSQNLTGQSSKLSYHI